MNCQILRNMQTEGLSICRVKASLILMISMVLWMGCEEDISRPTSVRQVSMENGLSVEIEGGTFTQIKQIKWGNGSRYEIEFSLESLKAEMSVTCPGCEAALISFRGRYNPQRYQVLSRLYKSSAQRTKTESERLNRGLLRVGDDLYEFASPVLDIIGEDRIQNEKGLMWSVLIHGDVEPVKFISGEEELTASLEDLTARRDEEQTRCVQKRQLEAYQLENDMYLVRHHISYQWQSPFRLGVISRRQTPQQLLQVLQEVDREGVDGVVILGGLSNGTAEELIQAREVLSETSLFWWALPGHEEVDIHSTWLEQIGPLNYALDLGGLRLIFMDLSYMSLSENQSSLISRWVDSKPLVSLDELSPHTLILFSLTPLVSSSQRLQQGLSYRVGAMRALSSLRAAHMTHHVGHKRSTHAMTMYLR